MSTSNMPMDKEGVQKMNKHYKCKQIMTALA